MDKLKLFSMMHRCRAYVAQVARHNDDALVRIYKKEATHHGHLNDAKHLLRDIDAYIKELQ